MAQLYYLRHGQSEANLRPDVIGGRTTSAPLSERGVEQAKRAGRYLAQLHVRPSLVAVSPAVRTLSTASHALAVMRYEGQVKIMPELHELSQGDCEGLPRVDVYTDERLEEIARLGKDFKLPGGESINELGERMYAASLAVDAIATRRGGFETRSMCLPASALVVTHETAIKALVAKLQGRSQQWVYETKLPNASLSRINFLDGKAHVDYLGHDIANY